MATNRYYCKKCDYLVEFDSRRTKNLLCPICSSDLTFSRFWGGVAGKKLYGRCDFGAKSYTVPDGVKTIEDRIVHNNIFSLDFLFQANPNVSQQSQNRCVFMSDAFGNPISEVSKVRVNDNEKYHLTITLSQNSYNRKEKYYLVVVNDAQDSIESISEFKIDIAFSNDFEDFGF